VDKLVSSKIQTNLNERRIVHQTLWVPETRGIDLFTRYPSTTKMSAVITMNVGKTKKTQQS